MEFKQFIEWAFMGLLTGILYHGVSILTELKNSVKSLDERVAVLLEKTTWHSLMIDKHDDRITKLETGNKA